MCNVVELVGLPIVFGIDNGMVPLGNPRPEVFRFMLLLVVTDGAASIREVTRNTSACLINRFMVPLVEYADGPFSIRVASLVEVSAPLRNKGIVLLKSPFVKKFMEASVTANGAGFKNRFMFAESKPLPDTVSLINNVVVFCL